MLLSISYDVIESLVIKLVYDNEKVKRLKVECGDYVSATYNKDSRRKTVEGYVKRIYLDNRYYDCNHKNHQHWSMIIDDSMSDNPTQIAKIEVSKILDLDVLRKKSETGFISTPNTSDRVTDLRLVGNTLQLSQDNGDTWVSIIDLPLEQPSIEDCDCNLVNKIKSIIPSNIRADLQKELIEGIAGLVQKEKDCNCDCHEPPDLPDKPPKPGCGCNSSRQPIFSSFTILND